MIGTDGEKMRRNSIGRKEKKEGKEQVFLHFSLCYIIYRQYYIYIYLTHVALIHYYFSFSFFFSSQIERKKKFLFGFFFFGTNKQIRVKNEEGWRFLSKIRTIHSTRLDSHP